MNPQTGAAAPGGTENYDFIMSPSQQNKGGGGFIKDPFIAKIIFLVGGAVVLMVLVGVIISVAFGSKVGVETYVSLAQREAEIVRISGLGRSAFSQDIKNAAISTQLNVQSHQNKWVTYLRTQDRTLKEEELALKRDVAVDSKLDQAKKASTFDTTYAEIMRGQLVAYASELKKIYDSGPSESQRQLLASQYRDIQMLLKTWPESTATE